MANSQDSAPTQHPDLLAAVVLHTLVSKSSGMTVACVAIACDRDPGDPGDVEEVRGALEILLEDGLAKREADLFRPTRAAVRARELSF